LLLPAWFFSLIQVYPFCGNLKRFRFDCIITFNFTGKIAVYGDTAISANGDCGIAFNIALAIAFDSDDAVPGAIYFDVALLTGVNFKVSFFPEDNVTALSGVYRHIAVFQSRTVYRGIF
jgi:hypothetical protein